MRFSLCVGLVCALSFAAFGGTPFPTASGDIADATAWGGTIPTDAEFSLGGSYTASKEVGFQTFKMTGGSNTFTPAAGVKINILKSSLNASDATLESSRDGFCLTDGASGTTQTISGGYWHFNNASLGLAAFNKTTGVPLGSTIVFQDGAIVTNVGTLCVAGPYADPVGSKIVFKGANTKLHIGSHKAATSGFVLLYPKGITSGVKGFLQFLNGASFEINSAFYYDGSATSSEPRNNGGELLVSGTGSSAKINAALYMGWAWNTGNRITVDDHATFNCLHSTVNIGYGGNTEPAISNIVTVKNGASFTAASANVTLGQTAARAFQGHSYGNQIHVLDGATWSSKSVYANNGTGALTITTNAQGVVTDPRYDRGKGKGVYWLGDGTHDNGVLVSNATMTLTSDLLIGFGNFTYNGWLKILDGSTVSANSIVVGYGRTNAYNTAEIRDSDVTSTYLQIGQGIGSSYDKLWATNTTFDLKTLSLSAGFDSFSNRMEFVDCRISDLNNFYLGGTDCEALLVDTPVKVLSSFGGYSVTYGSERARLTFRGTKSNLSVPGTSSWAWGGVTGTRECHNGTLSIEDGAELKVTDSAAVAIYVGDTLKPTRGNKLRIKNGKLACHYVQIYGTNTEFEISGAQSDVTLSRHYVGSGNIGTYSLFQKATNCTYRLTDGAKLYPQSQNLYFSFTGNCRHNKLVVENNAVLDLKNCVEAGGVAARNILLGYWGAAAVANISDSTLLVQSGGVITNAATISVCDTHNNRMIVDGGKVYCTLVSLNGTAGTNNWLVIRGNGSLVKTEKTIYAGVGLKQGIRFEVPAGGYTTAPIQSGERITLQPDSKFEIDLTAFLADGLKESKTLNLMTCGEAMLLDDAPLAAARASVEAQLAAAKCRGKLTLSSDAKTLTLSAAPKKGMLLLLK